MLNVIAVCALHIRIKYTNSALSAENWQGKIKPTDLSVREIYLNILIVLTVYSIVLFINAVNECETAQNLNERQLRPPSSFWNSETFNSIVV